MSIKLEYKIFKGWDHFNVKTLWQVVGVDNDYVGEFHSDKTIAQKEIDDLNNRQPKIIRVNP